VPHDHEYDPTLQSPSERRSLLSQGILRLRRLFVQVANITTLRTDTITERTPAAGVTIDGLKIKDGVPQIVEVINFIINGGGSEITTGTKGDVMVEFACTINRVTMLADQSGSIVVDIWKQAYADFPPEDANSITASAVPTISGDTDSQDETLTGWTTSIAAGDTLRYNVDSVATIEQVSVVLKVTRI
jgi:hypothetical protein